MSDDPRVLPHDLEAERAVLGAMLINNTVIDTASAIVRPEHFFRRAHRALFAVVVHLSDRKVAPDLVTVKDELIRRGELEEVGGPAYVASLTDGVPRSGNVGHYCGIVRESATRRLAIEVANRILADAYDGERRVAEIVTEADRAIIDLQRGSGPGRMVDLRERTGEIYDFVEHQVHHAGQLTGPTSGFPSLDELTLGWQPGDMVVVAARPSIGKTALILNMVIAAAKAGTRCAVFSLEMRTRQLQLRILSNIAQLPLRNIVRGELTPGDLTKVSEAMSVMAQLPIFIDDRGGQSIWDIRAACRRLRADGGLGLAVIDYLQLVPGSLERRGANRNEEMTDISRRTKALADECSIPVLALSQLNRGADSRTDKRPQLSDLRESGSLEQDADLVMFLHRKHHRASGPTAGIIDKQRNGPTGTVKLLFDRRTQTFTDAGQDDEAEDAPPPDEPKFGPTEMQAARGKR